jgi:hypothetical protein
MIKPIFFQGTILLSFFAFNICSGESSGRQINEKDSSIVFNTIDLTKEGISSKKLILSEGIGEYKLNSISSLMGMNSLLDHQIENDKWIASGSSNSGGMREGYDIDLSEDDLAKLNSMSIIISNDLTLSLSCNGTTFFNTPFKEDGMSYFLNKAPSEYSSYMSENLTENNTIIDEYLYLYAKDNCEESELSFINIAGISADAVVIKYDFKVKKFEMVLFYGDGFDKSTYIFE